MGKAQVQVNQSIGAEFARAMQGVVSSVDAILAEAAEQVADEARNSAAFRDYKGTDREPPSNVKRWSRNAARLRKKIKAQKSKFEDGGYIVVARAPHAHLVEFGHVQVHISKRTRKVVVSRPVPPHPFLRPALDKIIARLTAKLKGATTGQN